MFRVLQWLHRYVLNLCSKCFIYFRTHVAKLSSGTERTGWICRESARTGQSRVVRSDRPVRTSRRRASRLHLACMGNDHPQSAPSPQAAAAKVAEFPLRVHVQHLILLLSVLPPHSDSQRVAPPSVTVLDCSCCCNCTSSPDTINYYNYTAAASAQPKIAKASATFRL